MTRRIAVFGIGRNSYTNASVVRAIQKVFADHAVDWIDLHELCTRESRHLLDVATAFHAAREFGIACNLRRQRLWTTYLFHLRSRIARGILARGAYRFSLQIQSLFDASTARTPNFVYTDNTMLANMRYPDSTPNDVPVSEQWVQLERSIFHNARIVFVMSENVRRSLIEDYACEPGSIVCAYGGPNAPIERTAQRDDANARILFVGKEWAAKGGEVLLAAFTRLRARVPDARLTIVGCAPKIDEPGCEVIGRVPPQQLVDLYSRSSVFCLPTRREAFGIVFIEAMSYGLPIIASDVGAIPDFVREGVNGFRIPLGDVQALAARLECLLTNDALRKAMGERSAEIARDYTWERTARIMRETIEREMPPPPKVVS